jgi:putative ABC transport system substrate-binding protein
VTGSRPTGAFDPISDIRCAPGRFQEMRRREFISALLGASVRPHAARAEQKRVPRIGFLATSLESPQARATLSAFYQGLREHDYIDGQNVLIEVRGADSKIERFRALASELVGLNLDVIVASDSVAPRAVRRSSSLLWVIRSVTDLSPAWRGPVETSRG